MRRGIKAICLFVIMICLAGCSGKASKMPGNTSNVDQVLQEQVSKEENSITEDIQDVTEASVADDMINTEPEVVTEDKAADEVGAVVENDSDSQVDAIVAADGIDYDLTTMSSDMVYATVYQMMIDPDAYIGKTVKMSGTYYASYYEPTAQYYHYVIIQDAAACCAQGLEFVWEDGSHIYPEEYPEENAVVEVIGVFDTYKDNEDDYYQYCRLKDASMTIVDSE